MSDSNGDLQRQHSKQMSDQLKQWIQFETRCTCKDIFSIHNMILASRKPVLWWKSWNSSNLLVKILNSTKRLQIMTKYFLSCSGLSIVCKGCGAELNDTGSTENKRIILPNFHTNWRQEKGDYQSKTAGWLIPFQNTRLLIENRFSILRFHVFYIPPINSAKYITDKPLTTK